MGEEKLPKPMALGEAVSRGIIANETLAYFIGRTWLLFGRLGVDPKRMRFRQHLQHEVGPPRREEGSRAGRPRLCARTRPPVLLGAVPVPIPAGLPFISARPPPCANPPPCPCPPRPPHLPPTQMAHYAEDCWDAEVETTYGWVECAGLADRSAYDLRAHTAMSKTELTAYEKFPEPREVEVTT
jgi:hypothetical protein